MRPWRHALGSSAVLACLLLSACCPVLTPAPSAFVAEIVMGPGGELRAVAADGRSVALDFGEFEAATPGSLPSAGDRMYLTGTWAPDGSLTVSTAQVVPSAQR